MILKQAAHKRTSLRLQPGLQLPMLEPRRLLRAQPPDDLLEPLTRAAKRILARATAGREIACSSTSRALGLQELISRREKFAATGAGVGDHVAHPSWSTLVSATPTSAPVTASPATYHPRAGKTPAKPALPADSRPPILNDSGAHRPSTRAAPELFGGPSRSGGVAPAGRETRTLFGV